MKTAEFVKVAEKLVATGLLPVLEPKKHGQLNLGWTYIGATEKQNAKLWREYGTLVNLIMYQPAEKVNEVLAEHGVTEFIAKPTKSGNGSRLVLTSTIKALEKVKEEAKQWKAEGANHPAPAAIAEAKNQSGLAWTDFVAII